MKSIIREFFTDKSRWLIDEQKKYWSGLETNVELFFQQSPEFDWVMFPLVPCPEMKCPHYSLDDGLRDNLLENKEWVETYFKVLRVFASKFTYLVDPKDQRLHRLINILISLGQFIVYTKEQGSRYKQTYTELKTIFGLYQYVYEWILSERRRNEISHQLKNLLFGSPISDIYSQIMRQRNLNGLRHGEETLERLYTGIDEINE